MKKIRIPELAAVLGDDDTRQLEQSTGDLGLKFIDHAMCPLDLPPTNRQLDLVSLLACLGLMTLTDVEGVAA